MHATVALRDVSKSYGPIPVLAGVSFAVTPGSRIGLVGPNGAGKSTLLRLLAGLENPDRGAISRMPLDAAVGYLPQEVDAVPDESLLDYLARRTGVGEAQVALDDAERRLPDEPAQHAAALDRYLRLGGADFLARVRAVCAELGLGPAGLRRPVVGLSGGEAGRARLAALLLARFDVFLLDEPTNDLDFAGLERLERFLASLRGGVVLVSHDRDFLDRSVQRVVELDTAYGTPRMREYAGGFSEYEHRKALERERHEADYDSYAAERQRIEEQARQMRAWEERGYGQGRKKKKTKDVKKAYRAKLARLDEVEKPWAPWELRLELAPQARAGDVVARLDGAVVQRGAFRLGPIDVSLRWRDRLAVLGPNGSGKTTLLDALLGDLPLAAGRRWVGPGVVLGRLRQDRTEFAGSQPLLRDFCQASSLPEGPARTLLAKFDLGADDVNRRGSSLSAGERTRASLALLSGTGANCLVLDEPTNHLDLPAIEELEHALSSFAGTVVLVTHDRRLLERFEPTQTLTLGSQTAPVSPER